MFGLCSARDRSQFDEEQVMCKKLSYKTKKGKKLDADLLIKCVNGSPNTQMLKTHFADHLTPKGLVKVS